MAATETGTRVDPLIGQVVGGRYEVIRRIGKGGMGAIYEVRNTRLGGRSFALKTLAGEAAEDEEVLARFRREADVIARLNHPNVVDVIDWEQLADGSPCLVMEYLQGEDLSTRIRDASPLPWSFIARVADQVLGALSVAHGAGVVHRDLKPQNVFLAVDDSGEERAKLLDFGVSKIRDSRSLATTDARLIGTPSYMSPEQAEGNHQDVGPATDVWAMGAMLHEMATGELAFDGPNLPQILYRICSRDPEPVNLKRADSPPAFVQLVREAMARDPSIRVADADVMRVRLREVLRDVAGIQYPEVMRSRSTAPVRAAGGGTPLPTGPSTATPSTPRRRRFTDALGDTLASGKMAAAVPVATPLPQPTPVPAGNALSLNTGAGSILRRRPRWAPWVALVGVVAAGIAISFAIVRAGRDAPPPPIAPAVVREVPAAAVDAAVAAMPVAPVAAADAALATRPGGRIKRDDRMLDPPKTDPPKPDPPKPDPSKTDPPKKCDPNDPMCAFGTDQ